MKNLLNLIIGLTVTVSFAQSDKDLTEIVELIIKEYTSDSIGIYHKFVNNSFLYKIELAKSSKDLAIYKKHGSDFKIVAPMTLDDTVTVTVEKVKINYYQWEKFLKKNDKRRINRYISKKLKRNKRGSYYYFSVPLISVDGNFAIVSGGYNCGGLCGSGGVFFLEKIKGRWRIIEFQLRSVS